MPHEERETDTETLLVTVLDRVCEMHAEVVVVTLRDRVPLPLRLGEAVVERDTVGERVGEPYGVLEDEREGDNVLDSLPVEDTLPDGDRDMLGDGVLLTVCDEHAEAESEKIERDWDTLWELLAERVVEKLLKSDPVLETLGDVVEDVLLLIVVDTDLEREAVPKSESVGEALRDHSGVDDRENVGADDLDTLGVVDTLPEVDNETLGERNVLRV